MRAGQAPKPYKITEHRVAWREGDITAWQAARLNGRGAA